MFGMLPFERGNDNTFDTFDKFMRNFFDHSNTSLPAFRTDIRDAGDKFILEAELPGFEKEDIKLDVENDILTISAEHSYDSKDDEKAEEKAEKGKKNYVKRERYYGSYTRSFDVSAVEVDKIDAEYSDGVLKLTMPKKAALIPASRRLEIK